MKYSLILAVFILVSSNYLSAQPDSPEAVRAENAKIKQERKPNLKRLYELIRSADRVVVTNGSDGEQQVLFESKDPRDIEELSAALKLEIPKEWRLAVCADPTITLFSKGKEIARIGDVGGREVKTSVWSGNAVIGDQEKWLRWFDERGISVVRKERDHAIKTEKQYAADEARWYAAMPRGAKEPFEKQLGYFSLPSFKDTSLMKAALEREYSEKGSRIRAVLQWYGSGAGSWSGYPAYEQIAGAFLFEFSTKEIIEALNFKEISAEHVEGAARHFASWDFHERRPEDLKLIADSLRQRLLTHSLKSADEDKRERAKKAFAPESELKP